MKFNRSRFDLLVMMVRSHLKLRYNDSILGFLWVFLKPFLLFVMLYFVWTNFGDADSIDRYPVFLLLGLIVYTFFSEAMVQGMRSLLEAAEVILRINYPRQFNVFTAVILAGVNYIIGIGIFVFFGIFNNIQPNLLSILYFTFVSAALIMGTLAITLIFSIAYIWLRDLINMVELGMRLLFWGTPIFYSLGTAPLGDESILKMLVRANPLGIIIDVSREAMIYGNVTQVGLMVAYFIIGAVGLWWSWRFFGKQIVKLAEFF